MEVIYEEYECGGREETSHPRSLPPEGRDPFCLLSFYDDGIEIGTLVLCKTRWGFWETHVDLSDIYHGRGYGIRMYDAAIRYAKRKGWKVRSSLDTSQMAQRVWRSKRLRNVHRIVKKKKRFVVAAHHR